MARMTPSERAGSLQRLCAVRVLLDTCCESITPTIAPRLAMRLRTTRKSLDGAIRNAEGQSWRLRDGF